MARRAADPTDALEVLGHEVRVAVLRELAEADRPLSFTELRERVGIRDSGKFNYHLQKLRGRFVREANGGYELGHAGTRVIATVEGEIEDSVVGHDGTCPVCGREDCEKLFHVHLTPP